MYRFNERTGRWAPRFKLSPKFSADAPLLILLFVFQVHSFSTLISVLFNFNLPLCFWATMTLLLLSLLMLILLSSVRCVIVWKEFGKRSQLTKPTLQLRMYLTNLTFCVLYTSSLLKDSPFSHGYKTFLILVVIKDTHQQSVLFFPLKERFNLKWDDLPTHHHEFYHITRNTLTELGLNFFLIIYFFDQHIFSFVH